MSDDTNHIEVLRDMRKRYPPVDVFDAEIKALEAAITALSARASAGEGGGVPCPTCGAPCTVAHVKSGNAAYREYAYAAPQPAQTQGEGNDELFGEVRFPAKGSPWGYGA